MRRDHAIYTEWDAAYVLGALVPADRRAFEAHLEDCERCRTAVGELAAMPGLLAGVRPESESLSAGQEPPADLVERVTRRRDRQRRGFRRRLGLGIAAVAAAVAIAVAVPVLVGRPPTAVETVALAPMAPAPAAESSMTATVGLSPVAWGTSISIECDYPAGGTWGDEDGPWTYALVVTDDAGRSSQVSTWQGVSGTTVHLDAATAVPLDRIASLEIRTADGETILAAPVDA